MLWWQNGFVLGFVIFPAVAFAVGLALGGLSRRYWPGAVAGALTTLVLSVSVANSSLLSWIPVHTLLGFFGGAIGCRWRRSTKRKHHSP